MRENCSVGQLDGIRFRLSSTSYLSLSLSLSLSFSQPHPQPPTPHPHPHPASRRQVITGFLGSGKTTLLNHLLTRPREPTEPGQSPLPRLAVIENEFGEVDIDSALVASRDVLEGSGETVVTLSNGCLCCTVRDDLVRVLVELVTDPERRRTFDAIVIETTGLADPKPIIETFAAVEDVAAHCRLDGVVALVDAVNGWRHLGEPLDFGKEKGDGGGGGASSSSFPAELFSKPPPEAVSQVAYADRIVLNKCDLVLGAAPAAKEGEQKEEGRKEKKGGGARKSLLGAGEGALRELESRLRTINALAPLVRSTASKEEVDPRWVLGIGGYDLNRVAEDVEEAMLAKERAQKAAAGEAAEASACGNPAHGEPGHVCSHDHDRDAPCGNPAHGEPGHVCSHDHDHGHEVSWGEKGAKDERVKRERRDEGEKREERERKKLTKKMTPPSSSSSETLFHRPTATATITSTATATVTSTATEEEKPRRGKERKRPPPPPPPPPAPSRSPATTRPSPPSPSTCPGPWTSSSSTCGSGRSSTSAPRTSTG